MSTYLLKDFKIQQSTEKSYPKKAYLTLEIGRLGSFGYGCDMKSILKLELDEEDLEYLKNKYIPKELEAKEQEFSETLKKLNILESEIKKLKQT